MNFHIVEWHSEDGRTHRYTWQRDGHIHLEVCQDFDVRGEPRCTIRTAPGSSIKVRQGYELSSIYAPQVEHHECPECGHVEEVV